MIEMLRALGKSMTVVFGVLFIAYLFLFPVFGCILSLSYVLDLCESKGIKRSDYAILPIAMFTIILQSSLSIGTILLISRIL